MSILDKIDTSKIIGTLQIRFTLPGDIWADLNDDYLEALCDHIEEIGTTIEELLPQLLKRYPSLEDVKSEVI